MLYFNSGLVNISRELYEAAAIDGARSTQMFWHITVPLMRPTIIFVLIISVIGGFQLFVEPFLLWPGGNSPSGAWPVGRPAHLPDGVHVIQVR